MKTMKTTSKGTARRHSGLPIYEVGQRVKILRDVGRSRKPYGTIQDIQRRRNRLVLVIQRDNLPTPGLRGPFPVWCCVLPAACVTPLYWRGSAKTARNKTVRRTGYVREPMHPDEIESVRYIG